MDFYATGPRREVFASISGRPLSRVARQWINDAPRTRVAERFFSKLLQKHATTLTGPTPAASPRRDDASLRPGASAAVESPIPGYADALGFLYNRINYERSGPGSTHYPFRLQRMRGLLRRLQLEKYLHQPGRAARLPLVHIAGTKGKGSTSAMVAAMLSAAGYRTGLYTSPHLHQLEERFQVDGRLCTPQDLVSLVDCLRAAIAAEWHTSSRGSGPKVAMAADRMAADPAAGDGYSFFELTTALALLHFDRSRCEAIVLEVGLGGRLDSTNVCAPSVTAITSIGLDHEHVLGSTHAAIAREKAGIIKPGIPVVSGVTAAEPSEVIERIAAEKQSPLWKRGRDFEIDVQPDAVWGSQLVYRGQRPPLRPEFATTLALEGIHQAQNAAIAITLVDLLADQGLLAIDRATQGDVLSRIQCLGRIERYELGNGVLGVIDAAHNADSIAALCATVQRRSGGRPVTVLFGTSRDKAAPVMLAQLAAIADRFVLTQFAGNPRFQPVEQLMQWVPASHHQRATAIADPVAACEQGLRWAAPQGWLVVCGSFFLAAETRAWMAAQQSLRS